MKSIPLNDPDKNSSMLEHRALNQPIRRGASKTGLLAPLANNLSISALAAHSPLSPIVSHFVSPIFSLRPSAPGGQKKRGNSCPFSHHGGCIHGRGRPNEGGPTLVQVAIFWLFEGGGRLSNIR